MKKAIKVLDLRDSPWVDGPGRTVLDTASMIDKDRCEIIVGAFCHDGKSENDYLREALRRNIRVEKLFETGAIDWKITGQVFKLIKKYSIDVLHTHDFRSNVMGLYCARRTGVPIVVTCHGWIANNLKGKIYLVIDKFLLRFFDKVICVSEFMKEQLLGQGVSPAKIEVVPNALIVENFSPNETDQGFRSELGISGACKVITNIGRLSPEKGQSLFLSSAKQVLENQNSVCFVLVGVGPEEDVLRKQSSLLGLSEHVHFVGYRSDMNAIYNSTDLVVQSSFTEGMPNVLLEALLMETPVVASNVGGTREVLKDGEMGRLIDAGSVAKLTKGIEEFLSHPDRFIDMAKRGRIHVADNFSHTTRVKRLNEIYESLAVAMRSNAV